MPTMLLKNDCNKQLLLLFWKTYEYIGIDGKLTFFAHV